MENYFYKGIKIPIEDIINFSFPMIPWLDEMYKFADNYNDSINVKRCSTFEFYNYLMKRIKYHIAVGQFNRFNWQRDTSFDAAMT